MMGDIQETINSLEEEKTKFETILYSIGDGVFVIDNDFNIIVLNKMAAELSGYSEEKAKGKKYHGIFNFVYEKNGETNDKFIIECLAKGENIGITEYTYLIKKNGGKISVAYSAAPLKDQSGKTIGCVVAFRDITQEREVDKIKSEFVSLASHQLRTPLTSIRLFSEMLSNNDTDKLNGQQKEYIDSIQASTKQMIALVNDLLNVSRLEAGKLKVDLKLTDLVEFIKNIINDFGMTVKEKKCKIEFIKNTKNISKIFIDPVLMQQVIRNLIINAITYSRTDKNEVIIKLDEKNSNYILSVEDTGIDIDDETKPKIFNKFFRADNARKTIADGNGLGLYLSKIIMKAIKGKIWFDSKLDKGSTFYISIPTKTEKK